VTMARKQIVHPPTAKSSRHERDCSVCAHPDRREIEREFCEWKPLAAISRERKLSRPALYRHAHATNLFESRDKNIRAALSHFIERGYKVRVTASSFIAAIQAFAKINAAGEWIEKSEKVNASPTQELFGRMTRGEMLKYAETGALPDWWPTNTPRQAREVSSD